MLTVDDDVYLLECNPRATSGVHLLRSIDLFKALIGEKLPANKPSDQPVMISLAMLFIGLPIAIRNNNIKQWKADYCAANDILSVKGDKPVFFFSLLSLAELICIALKNHISIREASTTDIEWDGDDIQ